MMIRPDIFADHLHIREATVKAQLTDIFRTLQLTPRSPSDKVSFVRAPGLQLRIRPISNRLKSN
jgi:hypothetical protein